MNQKRGKRKNQNKKVIEKMFYAEDCQKIKIYYDRK